MKKIFYLIAALILLNSCNTNNESISENKDQKTIYKVDEEQGEMQNPDEIIFKDTILLNYKKDSIRVTDTFVFKDKHRSAFLMGTQALPSTRNQLNARRFNVQLNTFNASNCIDSRRAREGADWASITKIEVDKDSIKVTINLKENCCYNFLGDIGVQDDSTLNLIIHAYGKNHCACDCEYNLTYHLIKYYFNHDANSSKMKYLVVNGAEASRRNIR